MTQILELSDKDSKEALIKMLHQTIMNMFETNEKIKSLSKEIESISTNHKIHIR